MNIINTLKSIYSHPYNRLKPIDALIRTLMWNLKKRFFSRWQAKIWNNLQIIFYADSRESYWLARNWFMDMENHLIIDHADDLIPEKSYITVKVKTLDEYCEENNITQINFIKLDVEGAEYFILQGMKNLFEKNKVKVIQMEVNHQIEKFYLSFEVIKSFLSQFGFYFYSYNVNSNSLIKLSAEYLNQINHKNIFAILNSEDCIKRLEEKQ